MAKKYKGKVSQPNAPDLQTILLQSPIGQQPAHNPYYPDLYQTSPPPYTDLSTETTRMTATDNNPRYQRFNSASQPTVIVQQPVAAVGRDFTYSRYREKVIKCNRGLVVNSIMAILLSFLTMYLYSLRNCVNDFVIHQPKPEVSIRVGDLRNFSETVIGLSVFMLGISFIKSMIGHYKSSGCFLMIVALFSFAGMVLTGYMAYLSYYSPCVMSLNEIVRNSAKTIWSQFASIVNEKMPSPERGFFAETSVFNYIKEDTYGVMIFFINVSLCLSYFHKLFEALMC